MIEFISRYVSVLGLPQSYAQALTHVIAVLFVAALSFLSNLVAKRIIVRVMNFIVSRTKNQWDDVLAKWKVFTRLSHLVPVLVIWYLAPQAIPPSSFLESLIERAVGLYVVWVSVSIMWAVTNAVRDVYDRYPISKRIGITSFIQTARILLVILASILSLSIALAKPFGVLIGGIIASAAVFALLLREPIQNFGASLWIVSHQLVRKGERIEIQSCQVDGEVVEISLHTIVVRQNDMTLKAFPTYKLLSEGVKNWRGITSAGGRRIQRSIWIDMGTIKFLSGDALVRLEQIPLLKPYLDTELEASMHRSEKGVAPAQPFVHGFALTNTSLFRIYVDLYLRQHPGIHQVHTILVRQLQPKECGLPIEIYAATNTTDWPEHERIQAEIFDHLLAALPYFELRVYQGISGADVARAALASAEIERK